MRSDRWLLAAIGVALAVLQVELVVGVVALSERARRLEARVDELERWRADVLERGELIYFGPDGPRRVRLR